MKSLVLIGVMLLTSTAGFADIIDFNFGNGSGITVTRPFGQLVGFLNGNLNTGISLSGIAVRSATNETTNTTALISGLLSTTTGAANLSSVYLTPNKLAGADYLTGTPLTLAGIGGMGITVPAVSTTLTVLAVVPCTPTANSTTNTCASNRPATFGVIVNTPSGALTNALRTALGLPFANVVGDSATFNFRGNFNFATGAISNASLTSAQWQMASVPEPASVAMVGLGVLGCILGAARRRKQAK